VGVAQAFRGLEDLLRGFPTGLHVTPIQRGVRLPQQVFQAIVSAG